MQPLLREAGRRSPSKYCSRLKLQFFEQFLKASIAAAAVEERVDTQHIDSLVAMKVRVIEPMHRRIRLAKSAVDQANVYSGDITMRGSCLQLMSNAQRRLRRAPKSKGVPTQRVYVRTSAKKHVRGLEFGQRLLVVALLLADL